MCSLRQLHSPAVFMRVHKLVGRLIEIFLTQKMIGTVKIKFMKENYPESTLVIMFFLRVWFAC
jgi:hypothetical protein